MPPGRDGASGGRAFSRRHEDEINKTVSRAERETGLRYSVYVGRADGDVRTFARRLHAALGPEAARAVLVLVDPNVRALEIVTGQDARKRLDDATCGLAAMTMTTAFATGDLAGGIVNGISMLAEHARERTVTPDSG